MQKILSFLLVGGLIICAGIFLLQPKETPALASQYSIELTAPNEIESNTIITRSGEEVTSGLNSLSEGDVIKINVTPKLGYTEPVITVNGSPYTAGDDYTVLLDVKIVVVSSPIDYVLNFDANGGNICPAITANYGDLITLPTPTKNYYTFSGWYLTENANNGYGNKFTAETMPVLQNNSLTLYAGWTANEIFVTFNFTATEVEHPTDLTITLGNTTRTIASGETAIIGYRYGEATAFSTRTLNTDYNYQLSNNNSFSFNSYNVATTGNVPITGTYNIVATEVYAVTYYDADSIYLSMKYKKYNQSYTIEDISNLITVPEGQQFIHYCDAPDTGHGCAMPRLAGDIYTDNAPLDLYIFCDAETPPVTSYSLTIDRTNWDGGGIAGLCEINTGSAECLGWQNIENVGDAVQLNIGDTIRFAYQEYGYASYCVEQLNVQLYKLVNDEWEIVEITTSHISGLGQFGGNGCDEGSASEIYTPNTDIKLVYTLTGFWVEDPPMEEDQTTAMIDINTTNCDVVVTAGVGDVITSGMSIDKYSVLTITVTPHHGYEVSSITVGSTTIENGGVYDIAGYFGWLTIYAIATLIP